MSKQTKIILFIIAMIVIIWGMRLIVTSGLDLYWTIDTVGVAYYGPDFVSKDNVSHEIAATFANAKKTVVLSKMRNFSKIGAGSVMVLAGLFSCFMLLPRKRNAREDDNE